MLLPQCFLTWYAPLSYESKLMHLEYTWTKLLSAILLNAHHKHSKKCHKQMPEAWSKMTSSLEKRSNNIVNNKWMENSTSASKTLKWLKWPCFWKAREHNTITIKKVRRKLVLVRSGDWWKFGLLRVRPIKSCTVLDSLYVMLVVFYHR